MGPSAGPAGPGLPPADAMRERIRSRADPDGFVPFDRFMDAALYADGIGYYARDRPPFGPKGDFYTAPAVHPLFAATLARRLARTLASLPSEPARRIVEIGPGDGALAEGVLRSFGAAGPAPFEEYVLVERSDTLARRALERATAAAAAMGVTVRRAPSVAAVGPFSGAVLANELLDAAPARRLRRTPTGWEELGARWGSDRWVPAEAAMAGPVPGRPLPLDAAAGTIVEVSPAAEAIVREVADHLVAGAMVLLDYGMTETELVAGHPRGTLAAVRAHQPRDDPLADPGEADLSVFVNFDRIRDAARRAGWTLLADRPQAEALGAWGFPDLLADALRAAGSATDEVRLRLAAKNLLFGFDRFRAIELGIGTPADGPVSPETPPRSA